MFEEQKDLSEIMIEFRKKNKLTLRQLEHEIGLSYSYLGKIERKEVSPPRETIIQIANSLDLSTYQLLLSAGYIVNLERDISIKRLNWTEEKINNQLTTMYKIVATPFLSKLLETRRLRILDLAKLMKMDIEKIRDIINFRKHVSLIESRNFCMILGIYFYEIFRVKKVMYQVKFLGSNEDEEVALEIHRFVEEYRNKTMHFVDAQREISVTKEFAKAIEEFVKIPIYGEIKAGYGMVGEENIIGYQMESKSRVEDGEYFYLLVKGDSMIDDGIIDGCRVLVKKQSTVPNGKIGVCIINGEEATLKRVIYDGDKIILMAANKNILPKTYDISEVLIQGQVKSFVVDIN